MKVLNAIIMAWMACAVAANEPGPYPGQYEAYNPLTYQYEWNVYDPPTYNGYGQKEVRKGYNADGEYTVLLPDGRKQIVTYKVADSDSGYVADVRYEGEAKYEPYVPSKDPPFVVHNTNGFKAYEAAVHVHTPAPAAYASPAPVRPEPYQARPEPYQAPVVAPRPVPAYPAAPRQYGYKPVAAPPRPVPVPVNPAPAPVLNVPVLAAASEVIPVYIPTNKAEFKFSSKASRGSLNAVDAIDSLFYGDLGRIKTDKKVQE